MNPEEQHIFKLLRNAKLKECLAWFEDAPDDDIKDALRPLLFDEQSGAVRVVQEGVLQDELVKLASKNGDFRRFVKEWWQTRVDRITAACLKEMMESS
jgi:hypothetical protein